MSKNSVKTELLEHIKDCITYGQITDQNIEDWHHDLFNVDYYIIGYYQCGEWLKKHEIGAFEAIETVVDYEKENFGTIHTDINAEAIVNMYVFIEGELLLNDLEATSIEQLKSRIDEIL
jgi:hypothetical protein